ncbi:MAG: AMP-binding protein [Actinomycetota bacterium]|nr:AMP-binding protein [Actinomycetota bacterium]
MNVGLSINRNAIRNPNSVALFGHRVITYEELDKYTNQVANYLISKGLHKGERVAVLLANRAEVVELLGGITKSSLIYIGLNFRLGPKEMEQIFANSQPSLVFTDTEHYYQIEGLANNLGISVINIDDEAWKSEIGDTSEKLPAQVHSISHNDDFCIVYTSGTTGRPKGVLFDHARVLNHGMIACLEYEITPESRYLIQIPHNSSVNITIVPCLMVGASMGFRDSRNFDPEGFANQVNEDKVTHSFLVPTQLMRMLEQLPAKDDKKLSGMVTLGYGSSPISPERLKELVSRFGLIFNQLYGMAEIASIGTILRKVDHSLGLSDKPELLSSCGQPSLGVDVRVVDDQGEQVSQGDRGEVVFFGPHVMKGYYGDPERTQEVLKNGWMYSGDIAEVDKNGFIYIVDRKKNLIIRGGLNIAPTEIENVLYRHDSIAEVAVIGVPDPEWGESILAFVSIKDGYEIKANALMKFCKDSELTSIKIPERIEILPELPKNAVGKIAKAEIRSAYWGSGRQV